MKYVLILLRYLPRFNSFPSRAKFSAVRSNGLSLEILETLERLTEDSKFVVIMFVYVLYNRYLYFYDAIYKYVKETIF